VFVGPLSKDSRRNLHRMNEIAIPAPRSRVVASIALRAYPEDEIRGLARKSDWSAVCGNRAGRPEIGLRDSSRQPELPICQQIHRVSWIDRLNRFEV
jgi:hypothetical protein